MRRAIAIVLMCAIVGASGLVTCAAPVATLADPGGHWGAVYAEALKAGGALAGMPASLEMDAEISRAAFVRLFAACLGVRGHLGDGGGLGAAFVDVEPGHWAAPEITAAYERGWVYGYGHGIFRPDSPLSRAEAVVILYRAVQPSGWEEPVRPDGQEGEIPDWADRGVSAALALGWLHGDEGGGLRLASPVRVSEASALIWRAISVRGGGYDIAGTVSLVEPGGGALTVVTPDGEVTVTLPAGSVVFRNGVRCTPADIEALDELYVILGRNGEAVFAEASYLDDAGFVEEVDPSLGRLSYRDRSGALRRVTVDGRTDIRVLGNKSDLAGVSKGDRVYIVFDSRRGTARILDVQSINVGGRIISVSPDTSSVRARVANAGVQNLRVDAGAVVYVNDSLSGIEAVDEGDLFQGSLGTDGSLLFLQVFKVGDR